MHTFNETAAGVPAFLAKLWRLVDDPDTNNLICWSKDGRSFIIQNQAQFARELLPLNYKHNNMASFIRQLNMYGFHKITSIDNGGLKFDRDEMEFSHPCFKRNCPYLLEHIKRKIANSKSIDEKSSIKPEAVSKVLQDVKAMRGRQDSLDSRFSVMKQENEALWREIASLRQKHAKQQQIVNKLIQFLITIVQPSRNMTSVKRHMQLMIHDTPENTKLRKGSESESDCGPVIHELGGELLDEVKEVDPELICPNSPYGKAGFADRESPLPSNMERPHSSISMASQNYDFSNQSAEDINGIDNAPQTVGSTMNASFSNVNTSGASSVIHSVDRDGTDVIYHVTEIPDAQPHDIGANIAFAQSPNRFNEENVLHTPLVRQELARSQLLKQRNKLRRNQDDNAKLGISIPPTAKKILQPGKSQATATATSMNTPSSDASNIKLEREEIDPMLFLNTYAQPPIPEIRQQTLMSPNLNAESLQTRGNATDNLSQVSATSAPNDVSLIDDANTNMYNSSDFITGDIPSDIFDNSLLIGDDNTLEGNCKQTQQEMAGSLSSSGKFASFIDNIKAQSGGSGKGISNKDLLPNGPSTSAAAGVNSTPASNLTNATSRGRQSNISSNTKNESNNDNDNMAVAKYKLTKSPDDHLMHDEVNGHLEIVQDELETLRDLLRGDGYSFDANTLMGAGSMESPYKNQIFFAQGVDGDFLNKLFDDSDILGQYGLQFPADDINDNKKGSEVASYQPLYDLSDIIDANNEKPALMHSSESPEDGSTVENRNDIRTEQGTATTLNTPYTERMN